MTSHPDPECPACGTYLKALPPSRQGQGHVYCLACGHDFGRYETLVEHFRQALDELERRLGVTPSAGTE